MIGRGLSRREREVLDALHRLHRATAAEVLAEMPDPPSYSAVRSVLRILEEKGHANHEQDGKRYLYVPTESSQKAASSALKQVMQTFFAGSLENAVRTFLSADEAELSAGELDRLAKIIEDAKNAKEA
jgi:predicted transcriptional regulator